MIIGIVPNTTKENIVNIVGDLCLKLNDNNIEYLLSNAMYYQVNNLKTEIAKEKFVANEELAANCDMIISIGGDGTMLNTAYEMRTFNVPVIGLNIGKLGFLAEHDLNDVDSLVVDLLEGNYTVEERMSLEAICEQAGDEKLYAVNDIVIEKGRWPKMIDLTIKADNEYVSTFSADGLIVSTPTGSTGYSLSTGGPIINPKADVIGINPISPHSLTMRPLILSSKQKITILAESEHTAIQVNCDGQRVYSFKPPVKLEITKSEFPTRLLHTGKNEYFSILRKKLFWGLDVRQNSIKKNEK